MANTRISKGIFSQVIDFFASVKLVIVILIALAATSVIGTVLPQGEPLEMVVRRYGPATARLIGIFQLQDMYHSWWFQWLLLLLSANLIVCSIKRFSTTWKVIQAPPRSVSDGLFETLQAELENIHDPSNPLGTPPGNVIARVRFNEHMGYPQRYIRGGTGLNRGSTLEMLEFRPAGP